MKLTGMNKENIALFVMFLCAGITGAITLEIFENFVKAVI